MKDQPQHNQIGQVHANVKSKDMRTFLVTDNRLSGGARCGLFAGDMVSGAAISPDEFKALKGEIIVFVITSKGETIPCIASPAISCRDILRCTFPNTEHNTVSVPFADVVEMYHITYLEGRDLGAAD